MNALGIAGSVASILGACVSIVTLIVVTRIRAAIKRHSRHRLLTGIIDRILRIPATKETLPDSTCDEIRFVVATIRSLDLSWWFWLDRPGKRIADDIEGELRAGKRRAILHAGLELLRDELTVR